MCNPISTLYPEHVLAKGKHRGYEWEVTHNHAGYRCGYVRLPAGHAWHGKDYEALHVDVHGGLSFSEPDTHCGKGGPDDAWWLGFDCGHAFDQPDPQFVDADEYQWMERFGLLRYGAVRTTPYVIRECCRLIDQAAEV
jgi:hypothetical protein